MPKKVIYNWPENIFTNFTMEKASSREEYSFFVKRFHYSKSLARGCPEVYLLKSEGKLFGVAMFGCPVGKDTPGDLECKRFVLMRHAPKNVASWFMAKCIKTIKKNTNYKTLISYADPEAGHDGIMYKASNFQYLGEQKYKGQAIIMKGETVHLRAAYQKVNGSYTKTAIQVQKCLKNGTAKYTFLAKKHIFKYDLK